MKILPRHLFLCATAAFGLALTPAVFAQDKPQPDPTPAPTPASAEPTAGKPAVTAESSPAVTAPPVAAPEPAAPAVVPPAPAPAPASAEATPGKPADEPKVEAAEPPKLRRLDEPAPSIPAKDFAGGFVEGFKDESSPKKKHRHGPHSTGNDIVNVGSNSYLAKGGKADSVVAILGSATSEGEVSDAVVSVLGNTRVTGPVGDAAVAVLGNTYVDSKVGDSVVAVLGNVELGPNAEVNDVVAVGGTVKRDPKAIVHGHISNVGTSGRFSDLEWLHSWIVNCALYFRPLAFAPHLMWAWWIALAVLAFYILLALIVPKGVVKCVETFEQRPGYSILAALLTALLAPIAIVLLVFTVVGIAVIPFLAAGFFFAGLFGKTVMLAWIGRRFTKFLGTDNPALAVLIGGVIALLLYTVPVFGLILFKLLGWIGVGVVVYTLILGMKREKPPIPPAPPAPSGLPPAMAATPVVDPVTGAVVPPVVAAASLTPTPPVMALTLPRAGFWVRLAALLLDVIIVGMICSLLSGFFSDGSHIRIKADLLPSLAIYGALMWKLRGSTVGGIVCGLKVIRLDDRPIDWGTAIVRALSCFLSLAVMGLGFIWVVFDDQRQSWHDKIAGTVVVHAPRGVSLV